MHEHLGGVEHRLEVGLVEGDRLTIVLERLLRVPREGGGVAEEVVDFGRLGIELQGPLRTRAGAGGVTLLGEVPASVEMCRELIHLAFSPRGREVLPRYDPRRQGLDRFCEQRSAAGS